MQVRTVLKVFLVIHVLPNLRQDKLQYLMFYHCILHPKMDSFWGSLRGGRRGFYPLPLMHIYPATFDTKVLSLFYQIMHISWIFFMYSETCL